MARRPRVITKAVADTYSSNNERIIEFGSGKNGGPGGLIAFRRMDDDTLRVHIYRTDPGVSVYAESRPHHIRDAITVADLPALSARLEYATDGKRRAEAFDGQDVVWVTLHEDGTQEWRDDLKDVLPGETRSAIVGYLSGLLGVPLQAAPVTAPGDIEMWSGGFGNRIPR
jgi:hypothetical protein